MKASLDDNLVVSYYLSTSEIWPEKRGRLAFGGNALIRGGLFSIVIYFQGHGSSK